MQLAFILAAFTLGLVLQPWLRDKIRDYRWRVTNYRVRRATDLLRQTGYSVSWTQRDWGEVSPKKRKDWI